jgi:hypothetical protein
MRMRWLTTLLFALCIAIGMAGCGSGHEFLAAVQVSPAGGTATVASANDTVQFTAIGWYAPLGSCGLGGCGLGPPDKHQTLANANWTTSDSVNTSVNSKGLATCLSSTSSPATITATASGGLYGSISCTATLVCN